MKYKSVKHAIGHYAANLRGPKLAQGDFVRVQESRVPGCEWIDVGSAIHSPSGLGLAQGSREVRDLITWATTADGECRDGGPNAANLARILRGCGLLEERVVPESVSRGTCIDIYTGREIILTSVD